MKTEQALTGQQLRELLAWIEEAVEYVGCETWSPSLKRDGERILSALLGEGQLLASPAPAAPTDLLKEIRAIVQDQEQPLGNRLQMIDARVALFMDAEQAAPTEPDGRQFKPSLGQIMGLPHREGNFTPAEQAAPKAELPPMPEHVLADIQSVSEHLKMWAEGECYYAPKNGYDDPGKKNATIADVKRTAKFLAPRIHKASFALQDYFTAIDLAARDAQGKGQS